MDSLPQLETRRLTLDPVGRENYSVLFTWRNTPLFMDFFSGQRTVVEWEKFVAEQEKLKKKSDYGQFVVRVRRLGEPAGLVYFFNLNSVDKHAFANVFICEKFVKKGYGAEAGIALLCFMFDVLGLYKVYFDVFAYNKPSHSMLQTSGFTEEAKMCGHRLFAGQRHDVFRYAAYKSDADRLRHLIRSKPSA